MKIHYVRNSYSGEVEIHELEVKETPKSYKIVSQSSQSSVHRTLLPKIEKDHFHMDSSTRMYAFSDSREKAIKTWNEGLKVYVNTIFVKRCVDSYTSYNHLLIGENLPEISLDQFKKFLLESNKES